MKLVEVIAQTVKEGLSVWKEYLSGRQEAYERNMDKKKVKAIDIAEEYIRIVSKTQLGENKDLRKLEEKFFKYNN